ncbi:hypothetical protein EUZ95_00140 [Enterococcus durans]|nr:hypothetical protein B7758_00225 [Enterococcus durans]TBX36858.1 hypothetical protein EUZ95_00140 [Enterococcus durans]
MIEDLKEWGINLKIRFATDSRVNGGSRSNSFGNKHFCPSLSPINGVQKSDFSENSKKGWDKSVYYFCPNLFFLQFLKPK